MKRTKPFTEVRMTRYGELFNQDTRTDNVRKRWWTKARIPGAVRKSRMPGGSGYRGDKLWEGAT